MKLGLTPVIEFDNTGLVLYNIRMGNTIPNLCSFDKCDRNIKNKTLGLCVGHYGQHLRGKALAPLLLPGGKKNIGECEFSLCRRDAKVLRMCDAHYRQHRRGEELSEIKKKNPTGMGSVNKDGYRVISLPGHFAARNDGRMFEHVYVMAESIGRRLLPHETVHHKNGDRVDNRIENLELWSTSQPRGQRATDKLSWAKEIISLYEGLDNIS